MPKYYIICGDLRAIVDCEDAKAAAILSLDVAENSGNMTTLKLDHFFEVSERGFESPASHLFEVEKIIKEAGWELGDE